MNVGVNNHAKYWADLMVGDIIIQQGIGGAIFILVGEGRRLSSAPAALAGFYWHVYILVPSPHPCMTEGLQCNWIWTCVATPELTPIPLGHDVLRGGRFLRMD